MSGPYGVRVWASDGTTVVFDSLTALGGVVGDFQTYAAGAGAGTLSYPQWAGLNAMLIDCGGTGNSATLSTSSGYPVITVAASGSGRSFALLVY